MELVPPMPDITMGLSQDVQGLADKPSIEETSHEEEPPKEEEQTAEPLGPILITDPSTTNIDPAATAGKWPTEAATTERDDENET